MLFLYSTISRNIVRKRKRKFEEANNTRCHKKKYVSFLSRLNKVLSSAECSIDKFFDVFTLNIPRAALVSAFDDLTKPYFAAIRAFKNHNFIISENTKVAAVMIFSEEIDKWGVKFALNEHFKSQTNHDCSSLSGSFEQICRNFDK